MEQENSAGMVSQIFYRCVEDCYEPIMLTDRKGLLTYVNPAWSLTYGYSKNEAMGKTPRLLRSQYQDGDFYKKMWETIADPSIGFWRGEVTNKAKDGHLVPVILTITPFREASGQISGYMGIAVDLSEQKKMEQQILQQDRLASVGMLAGGLAHEIGNPLGVIRGRAELVLQQVQGNEGAEKNLELILGQIDRISGLIQSLLRVSRVPDKVMLQGLSLQTALTEVATLTSEACRKAHIELRMLDLNQNVDADPGHLQQLFLNLVLNAMHAIEEARSKDPERKSVGDFIEISAKAIEDSCVIKVRDTGCGISPANVSRVFQPFFTTKAAGKGTGLGLAIVWRLLEEMGGTISVESPGLGMGSTFTVHLKKTKSPEMT